MTASLATAQHTGLRIGLLGGFTMAVGSHSIAEQDWRLRKAKSLVKLLALTSRHRMHKERVTDTLWPDIEPASASNNLYKAIHVARKTLQVALPPHQDRSFLSLQQESLVLWASDDIWIDVEAFRDNAARASRTGDPAAYEEALSLYSGDLLPEDQYEDWVMYEQESLRAIHSMLLFDYSDVMERRGEPSKAIDLLRRVLQDDPIQEDAQIKLIRLLAETGHRHLALRQYAFYRDLLQKEHGLAPNQAAELLYQKVVSGNLHKDDYKPRLKPTDRPAQTVTRRQVVSTPEPSDLREQLHRWVDTTFAGHGGLTFVPCNPGTSESEHVGKAIARAAQLGAITLTGSARHTDSQVPYSLFATAIEDFARSIVPSDYRRYLGETIVDLVPIAPSLRTGFDAHFVSPSNGPHVWPLFSAIARMLTHLATFAPVVLVLRDLHLADESNLYLLRFLEGALRGWPILMIGMMPTQSIEADTDLTRLIRDVDQSTYRAPQDTAAPIHQGRGRQAPSKPQDPLRGFQSRENTHSNTHYANPALTPN